MMGAVISLLTGFFAAASIPYLLIPAMRQAGCVDASGWLWRKIHKKDIPLGGGVAIIFGIGVTIVVALFLGVVTWFDVLYTARLPIIGLSLLVLLVGGFLDDKYALSAKWQIIAPLLAVGIVVIAGVVPLGITNVFTGSTIVFSSMFGFFPAIIAFLWLIATTFATKVVDGVDGLVASILVVGGILLGVSSLMQGKAFIITLLAFSLVAAGLGFLRWNWHPASLFLGEGGSTAVGFLLGVVALLAESKFSVAFFVLALPLLDMVRVVSVRIKKRRSIFHGDKEHLHHRLLESGFSQTRIVYFVCGLSLLSGLIALFVQRSDWLYVFTMSLVFLFFVSFWLSDRHK